VVQIKINAISRLLDDNTVFLRSSVKSFTDIFFIIRHIVVYPVRNSIDYDCILSACWIQTP